MSQATNLAFFRARRGQSESLGAALTALVEPTRVEAGSLNFVIHPRCADVFILYFPNKTRRICSGSSSYNIGPLLGPEGVAQNIPSGRDDFSNLLRGMLIAILKASTRCGSGWNPPCSELITRAHSCLLRPGEYPPDDRDSSSRTGYGFVRTKQGGKEMSMSSKPNRKRISEIQATSTQAETGEVSVGSPARDEKIRRRAYEIYRERGEQPGRDLDDWLQAERELKRGMLLNPECGSAAADIDRIRLLNCHDLGDC
jgi:hypothetical protein